MVVHHHDSRPFEGCNILLAEDNIVNQELAQELLEELGCAVKSVDNGQAVLDILAGEISFDAIFLDCQMPVLDGYTTAAEIRRGKNGHSKTPIIALTAHALQGTKDRCLAVGMNDYLCKPLDPSRLRETLGRWLLKSDSMSGDSDSGIAVDEHEELQVLDMEQALWVTGGKSGMFERIARVFLNHIPQRFEELAQAVADEDYGEAARLAHSIKGASASVGGVQLPS